MARACTRCDHQNAEDAKFCRECGAMLEVDSVEGADPLVGRVLQDRYRIKSVLGEGGMGKVYLAEQKMGTATRDVAVKTLHQELSSDPQLVARFHRECQTVIELHHPNTVKFFDFGELEDKTLYIVMELIKGEDLAKRLERGALPPDVIDRVLVQVCGSLAEAHEHGVVHRDLKPENVLLTSRGGHQDYVKVLDFGIAKRSEAEDQKEAKLTKQGMVLGTPPYMSPEQFSGMALDLRSDIYSLGVMTYEMVTGHLPFQANTPWEWATRHLTSAPNPIDSYPEGAALPDHQRAAIMRALQKTPEDRQATALQFMQEFTGAGDPQMAWTRATTSGVISSSGERSSSGTGRMAIGTPQPSSSSQPGNQPLTTDPMAATAYNMPGVPTPPHGSTGPMGAYPTGGMPVQTGSFPLGKVIAGLAVALLIVGGAAGGTIYLLLRDPAEVATHNPAAATVVDPSGGTTNGVPSTPTAMDAQQPSNTEGDPAGAGAVAATPTAMTETPTAMDAAPTAMTETPSTMEAEPTDEPVTAMTSAMTSTAMTTAMVTSMSDMRGMDRPTTMRGGDRSGGQAALRRAQSALNTNNLSGAITGLRQAQRSLGRNDPDVRALRTSLGRRAANKVGILMQQGRCRPAQALFRDLRSVGASGPSSRHFSDDWCPRP